MLKIGSDLSKNFFLRRGRLEREDSFQSRADAIVANLKRNSCLFALLLAARRDTELEKEEFFENHSRVRRAAKTVKHFEIFVRRRKVNVHQRFAASWQPITLEHFGRKRLRDIGAKILKQAVNKAPDHSRANSTDRFVNGNDAANFGRIRGRALLRSREDLYLGIDHLAPRSAIWVHVNFAVENERCARLEASLEIRAVKKAHAQNSARVAHFHQKHGIAIPRKTHRASRRYLALNCMNLSGYDLSDGSETDAVLIAEGKILH